jgi:hypothetical protein
MSHCRACDKAEKLDDFGYCESCGGLIENQKQRIKKKWIYSDKHAIEELNKLSQQNAEMLAMLKTMQVWGELYSQDHKIEFVQLAELIKKVEGGE